MEGPAQGYSPSQHLIDRKIKIKESSLSRDLGQAEVTTEKVEGTIVKATESNNQGKVGAEYPSKQPHGTTLTRTIALLPPRRKIWHSRLAKRRGAKQKLIMIAQVMMRLMTQACSHGEKNCQDAQEAKQEWYQV